MLDMLVSKLKATAVAAHLRRAEDTHMKSSPCPCCGEGIQQLKSKAANNIVYCQSCGWNVARAQGFLAFRRRGIIVALVFFAVWSSIVVAFSPNFRNSLEDGLLIIILLGSLAMVAWRQLSRDSRALAGPSIGASGTNGRQRIVPQPDAQIWAHFEHVRALERPRLVQLNQATRSARKVVSILPVGMWLWGIHDLILPGRPIGLAAHGPVEARAWAAVILGCGTVLWFLLRRSMEDKRQLSLLKNGEVALGYVTGPLSHSVLMQGVSYEFRDLQGCVVKGRCADIQGRLDEDDYVLVLYDPQKSQKCIALCATNYEFTKP